MEGLGQLVTLIFFGVIFYLLIIRPQQKRTRERNRMIDATAPGDRIVTIGGLHGTVQSMDEETLRLEIAPDVVITLAKGAVGQRIVDADQSVTLPQQ